MVDNSNQVALVTGAARRIGAEIVRKLHSESMNVILHYNNSKEAAEALANELNQQRANSIVVTQFNLTDIDQLESFKKDVLSHWGRLDVLVNNASTFYPTPIDQVTIQQFDDLFDVNLKAPLFISKVFSDDLNKQRGSIINIVDIHGDRPLKDHAIYSSAKAGLIMLTKSLARELAPSIRVNGIAPGAIMWPEHEDTEEVKQAIINRTALKRKGHPADIANAVWFLIQSDYITGQIINVDGGRTLSN